MSTDNTISRRALFMKIGILFNGLVAAALAVPIVRFLLSPIIRGTRERLSLMGIARFRQPIPGRRNAPRHVSESLCDANGRQDGRHRMLGKARRSTAISDFRH